MNRTRLALVAFCRSCSGSHVTPLLHADLDPTCSPSLIKVSKKTLLPLAVSVIEDSSFGLNCEQVYRQWSTSWEICIKGMKGKCHMAEAARHVETGRLSHVAEGLIVPQCGSTLVSINLPVNHRVLLVLDEDGQTRRQESPILRQKMK